MEERYPSLSEPSDEALVDRVAQRDVTALSSLYDRYVQAVYAMAVQMVGRSTEAEEIVQEVFLQLWHKAEQFDARRGSFKAWFMSLARYRVLDELRRRQQREQLMAADDVERILVNAADPTTDVEKSVRLREDGETILQALQALPVEQRRVLVLAYFGGLSQASIAQHLGIPLGTVKKRIRLGLQKLRAALGPLRLEGKTPEESKPTNS